MLLLLTLTGHPLKERSTQHSFNRRYELISIPTNTQTSKPKFSLGQVLATPGALEALEKSGESPAQFLTKHVAGDWGEVCADDKALNDESLIDGSRILSAYRTNRNEKLWIITEAADEVGHCCCTTILLPSEY